ncbi:MAG: flagellar biosynthesis protein FlgI [Gammaproteobacteria bacterium]|nr:MAG: flagellar biosynthesis protein FlgI [Gammaproteobacteria bacterium]
MFDKNTKSNKLSKLISLALLLIMFSVSSNLSAERIKDIAEIQGVRGNPLVGYGLVVGLDGTGEQTSYTTQAFKTMLKRFGITLPANIKPKLKNIAAVAVHAEMPAFIKTGQTIDITVSSLGDAKSLRGGALLMTPLTGIDGNVYAVAQGNLVVGGFGIGAADGSSVTVNIPTVGRIPDGAIIERTIASSFGLGNSLTLNLHRPDFTTAKRVADSINSLVGPGTAFPMDGASIKVGAPIDQSQRVMYLATIENLQIIEADGEAKVVVNSRTGTIVIGKNVRVSQAAVAHGNLIVSIKENSSVSQPAPFSRVGETVQMDDSNIEITQENARMFMIKEGIRLQDIVKSINAVGTAPSDLMAILEALKEAGALHAKLVVI